METNSDYDWNGFCPESFLKGEHVRMKLNSYDFYESEKTGLQIGIPFPGVQAVLLNFRGKGKFRATENYADEVFNGEMLTKQTSENFPYCEFDVFKETDDLIKYISTIM